MKSRILVIIAALAMLAVPAAAQFTPVISAGDACPYAPQVGIDTAGNLYGCGTGTGRTWIGASNGVYPFTNKTFDTAAATANVFNSNGTPLVDVSGLLGVYQGTTSTGITTGNFTALTGPTTQKLAAGKFNTAGKTVTIEFAGVYTNAAASLLNVEISLCTVAGCASGTVVSPAGCVVISTNQANNLTNGQFYGQCVFTVATTGATGTLMAKSTASFNLGAATSAVLSTFGDLATAVSAAVDLTVDEFVQPQFKFTTSNAGNSATLQSMRIRLG